MDGLGNIKVLAPLNDNRQTLKYNPYIDDAINASESKLVEKSVESIPIATSSSGLVKASASPAGKMIPMIGSAFMAKDLVDGYIGSSRTFKDPDIVEKLSNALASAANGLTIGLIPIDKSAKGIASIINNKYYGSLDDIVTSQEEIDRINYINGLEKIDNKVNQMNYELLNKDGLGRIPVDIRLDLARSKERDDLAKQTRSWSGDYDYGKSDQIQAANGHYSDSGKLPWHPTFSTESEYSSPEFKGGTWTEDHGANTMYNPNPKVTYTPSEDMIKAGTTKGLVEYMRTREPGVELRTPVMHETRDNDITKKVNGLGTVDKKDKPPTKTFGGIRG